LDDYPLVDRRELKSIDAEFQEKVGYWASYNHLQDYKIYGTLIKIFKAEFEHKQTKPPKNCSHKYNLSTIFFLGILWTSHLGLFLFVLSIFD
jgi:hypothetical protein